MNWKLKSVLGTIAIAAAAQASATITFYEGEDFHGRAFTTTRQVADFNRTGFNDRASSVVVDSGRWEVCEDARYSGRCVVLREGSYDSLKGMGVNNRISSVRPVGTRTRYENEAPPPMPSANYDYRRRADERVFEVPVQSVHAVVGPQEQRCWVERQQVNEPGHSGSSTGGAVVGAIVGGVLGHQIGSGHGKDIATVGGAAAGAAIGSNAGHNSSGGTYDRDVRHCEAAQSGPPDYWDVTYEYRGVEHRVQMSSPPGRTLIVNRNGEPRQ
jgi:uncharacterized protein YcfJ